MNVTNIKTQWPVVVLMLTCSMIVIAPHTHSQEETGENALARIGISAGMGVNYHHAADIVERVNGSDVVSRRVDDFKSGAEFFAALSLPVGKDWVVKAEYAYMLASYSLNAAVGVGVAEFSYAVHLPTLIAQYILFEAPTYNLRAGAGAGYHFGSYEEKFFGKYTARGIGTLLELEGNTALGEDLFAHIGVQTRWDFIGDLNDSSGRSPFRNLSTTLHFFSIGVRLGMTYYL